ncbi:hypothetical protein D3C80_1211510 [compost metagenome]
MTVHRGRGQRLFQECKVPLWERYVDHGGIRFAVNTQHPLITSLATRLPAKEIASLLVLLEAVAASLPVEMIYSDYSTSPREVSQVTADDDQTFSRLQSLRQAIYGDGPVDPKAFLQIVRSTHFFEGQIELVEEYIRETFE